jgi:tRNA-2-methylthio-N6-dimethylallyladenosine synthase
MSNKFYIKTLGCQMNEYDSARMADVLKINCGLELTSNPEEADVILLNTCSIREKAQEKVFSQLGMWRTLKQHNPNLIIGVGGCVASQEGAAILKRAPFIDLVFGPQTLHRLPKMIDTVRTYHKAVIDVSFPQIEKFDCLPIPQANGITAFVSIMEGCSHYCTYCVVPYTRGEEISRSFDDVINEIASLAIQGVREVTLLGQNVNAYQGNMHDGSTIDLAFLIRHIAAIDGIERIRFTTSHPLAITDSLLSVLAEEMKLAGHLHLPVQSGSDKILMNMRRGYTAVEYISIVNRIRQARPNISLSSDIIVGFPGETEADFMATLKLIEAVNFDNAFSFIYSPRPGTPAATYTDDVSLNEKQARLARLQSMLETQAKMVKHKMIGSIQRVLVEGIARKNTAQLTGRADNNQVVNFEGNASLIGQFIPVLITEAMPNSLRGIMTI